MDTVVEHACICARGVVRIFQDFLCSFANQRLQIVLCSSLPSCLSALQRLISIFPSPDLVAGKSYHSAPRYSTHPGVSRYGRAARSGDRQLCLRLLTHRYPHPLMPFPVLSIAISVEHLNMGFLPNQSTRCAISI
ncbi:hypothetical protein PIB30_076377 [Stylosanthes scabra]|uniref:Uncharacterized protein n=1 Tax=Stylosanthes scabra TaxID=79078 RepID=A0ABU6RQK4_9FABA|nr:hypothetical protein [Stylosanthes scabra]